tara:strand:+ start:39 stop:374 length:336 start_codon:yes stop_codon:yes gene_type:complete
MESKTTIPMAIYNVTAQMGAGRPDRILATTIYLTEASRLCNHFLAQDRPGVQEIRVVREMVQESDAREQIELAKSFGVPTSMLDVKRRSLMEMVVVAPSPSDFFPPSGAIA